MKITKEALVEFKGSLIKRKWLRFLYPSRCPICDRVLSSGESICPECRNIPKRIGGVRCMKCGKALQDPAEEYCRDCREIVHSFDWGRALYEYTSIRPSIYRFKYKGRREYADFYGKRMARGLGGEICRWDADIITSVPLHGIRQRKRGYNQAALLAQAIGDTLGIPVDNDLVKRVKNTKPLKLLAPLERKNNLKSAFKLSKSNVKSKTIIIVDDIYTTGSTIDAVSRVLRDAGAKKICFLAIAAGRDR